MHRAEFLVLLKNNGTITLCYSTLRYSNATLWYATVRKPFGNATVTILKRYGRATVR